MLISGETDNSKQYSFGDWRFNADTRDLSDSETTTRLEPQVAKLLEYFLSHQNRVISRDELIAAVWENRIVSDDAINRCISILRHTLSPDDTHALIETVTRRGYLSHFPPGQHEEKADQRGRRRRTPLIVATAAVIAVIATFVLVGKLVDSTGESTGISLDDPPVVAVLPFSTSGQGRDSAFFANGVHDDLLTRLAQLQALRVISRTSVLEYRDRGRNLREIGGDLGADAILEGNVQSIGDQIHINVQLIDVSTDEHLWAQTYDRELSLENLFAVQSEIARAIAAAMHTTLTAQDAAQLAVLPTQNMAAYRAYHRAMTIRDDIAGGRGVYDPAYLEALEVAVMLDPSFTRAWAELAGRLSLGNFSEPDPESIQRVEQILEQIRTLAPDSADHLIAQAYYTYYILRNYDQALQLITQAQEMRPSDARLLELKSWIQRRLGDFEDRIESLRQARILDPRNIQWTIVLVRNLMAAHRYDEASREIASAAIQHYELLVFERILDVRHHRNFDRWAEEVTALQREFEQGGNLLDLWDALIASRDYLAAEKLLHTMPDDYQRTDGNTLGNLANRVSHQILTGWLLQQAGQNSDLLNQPRKMVDEQRNEDGSFTPGGQILSLALVAAAEGNAAETERLVRRWRREVASDLAEFSARRHFACRMLGMVAATSPAVDCIRAALEEPSVAAPFIEPFLPYYDSIRDEPEFVELLTELAPAR